MTKRLFWHSLSQIFSLFHFWSFCLIFPPEVLGFCQPGCQCLDDHGQRPEAICSGLQGIPIMLNPALRRLVVQNFSFTGTTPFRLDPYALAIYTELEVLDLSWNGIFQLPPGLFKPLGAKLRSLSLRGNRLTSIEDSGGGSPFARLNHLESLDLSENRLTQFPEQLLVELPSVKVLSLASNLIAEIPTSVHAEGHPRSSLKQQHKNLSVLDLSNNLITQIASKPNVFDGFAQLKRLNLSRNGISNRVLHSLTHSGSLREHLQVFDISENPIQVLRRADFEGFRVLRELHLKRLGFLRTIESTDIWRRLTLFDLEGNRLNCTCATLAFLPSLVAPKGLRGNAPICESPTAFLGMNILSLRPGQPEYPLVEAMCPELHQDSKDTFSSAVEKDLVGSKMTALKTDETLGADSSSGAANIDSSNKNPIEQEHEESEKEEEEEEHVEGDSVESVGVTLVFITIVGVGILLFSTATLCIFGCKFCVRRRKRTRSLRHYRTTTTVMQQEHGGGGETGGRGFFAQYGGHQQHHQHFSLASTTPHVPSYVPSTPEQGRRGPCFLPLCFCCLLDSSASTRSTTSAPSTAEFSNPFPTPTTLKNGNGSSEKRGAEYPDAEFLPQQAGHQHHNRHYRILQEQHHQQHQGALPAGRLLMPRQCHQQKCRLYTTGSDSYTDSLIYSRGGDEIDHGAAHQCSVTSGRYYTFTRENHQNHHCDYLNGKRSLAGVNCKGKNVSEQSTNSPVKGTENFANESNELQNVQHDQCLQNNHQEDNCCLPNTSTASSASSSSSASVAASTASRGQQTFEQQTPSGAKFLKRQTSGKQLAHHPHPAQSCSHADYDCAHQRPVPVIITDRDCNHRNAEGEACNGIIMRRLSRCSCCCTGSCYYNYSRIPPPPPILPQPGTDGKDEEDPLPGYCSCRDGIAGEEAHGFYGTRKALFQHALLVKEQPQQILRPPPAFPPPLPPPHQQHLVDLSSPT